MVGETLPGFYKESTLDDLQPFPHSIIHSYSILTVKTKGNDNT